MDKEEAKAMVDAIIHDITTVRAEKYFLDGRYVRWGYVQRDLHKVIDQIECDAVSVAQTED